MCTNFLVGDFRSPMPSHAIHLSPNHFDAALEGDMERVLPYKKIPSDVKRDLKLCLHLSNPYELARGHPLLIARFHRYAHQFSKQRYHFLQALLALAAINEWSKKRIHPILSKAGIKRGKKKLSPTQTKKLKHILLKELSPDEKRFLHHASYVVTQSWHADSVAA